MVEKRITLTGLIRAMVARPNSVGCRRGLVVCLEGAPMSVHRIAVIGLGAITFRAHLPVIAAHPDWEIVAGADPHPANTTAAGMQYSDYREMLAAEPGIEAVAICTPPGVRQRIALDVIAAGKHVLLEKPPCSTLGELRVVQRAAKRAGVTLMVSWHSRFGGAVERAREILADQHVEKVDMVWKEDAAAIHSTKGWMWRTGGYGVLDFGINGLSILTRILPEPLVVRAATLHMPDGAETPVAADIDFAGRQDDCHMHAEIDWRSKTEIRTIDIVTRTGRHVWLPMTGHRLEVDGAVLVSEGNLEYDRLYDRFAELIDRGESEFDDSPLVAVADASLIGRRVPAKCGI
jgi:D-galactose 1-dehydrogenase